MTNPTALLTPEDLVEQDEASAQEEADVRYDQETWLLLKDWWF